MKYDTGKVWQKYCNGLTIFPSKIQKKNLPKAIIPGNIHSVNTMLFSVNVSQTCDSDDNLTSHCQKNENEN